MVAHISAGPVTTSCANAISRSWPEKHGGGAAHQIAQIVSQIDVDGLDQQLIGEISVAAEGEGSPAPLSDFRLPPRSPTAIQR